MKLVLISDTHGLHNKMKHELPKGDLLIHAGDLTNVGAKYDVHSAIDWLLDLAKNYTHGVVFVAGNHDKSFDPKYYRQYEDHDLWTPDSINQKPTWLRHTLSDLELSDYGVTYLENESVTFSQDGKDYKIWGSPITPWFGGDYWAFNEHRGKKIAKVWEQIPLDTDVVVTHGPMLGLGDYIPSQDVNVGCEDLMVRLDQVRPKLIVCGHIHEGYGTYPLKDDRIVVNASICDADYRPINEPIVINI